MLSLSSQPIPSALGSYSHPGLADVSLPISDSPTDRKIQDQFGTLLVSLLAKALAPVQLGNEEKSENWPGTPLDIDGKDKENERDDDLQAVGRLNENGDAESTNLEAGGGVLAPQTIAPVDLPAEHQNESDLSRSFIEQAHESSGAVGAHGSREPASPQIDIATSQGAHASIATFENPVAAPDSVPVSLSPDYSVLEPIFMSTVLSAAQCQDGRFELELELPSTNLGLLLLRISMDGSKVNVHMLVGDDEAKRRLKEHLCVLRARFADVGVDLVEFSVERSSPGKAGQSAPYHPANLSQTDWEGFPKLRQTLALLTNPQPFVDIIT